ncbi:fibroleukin-like [Synchiropus splendidus]|uniref:fibroleukin-like n=1 Tax=Synchiropus splendidus TaxID=270530 RepID=UPI00237E4242|nr:fibroleukin-like [Synchiropus splendidus]
MSADSGVTVHLEEDSSRPCTATLTPEGICRHGQDQTTCPYRFDIPPLTVHLPNQLIELEEILKDLQNLKDNVDELRKMCVDCNSSGKECGSKDDSDRTENGRGCGTDRVPAARRDCSDHLLRGKRKSGVYLVTPDLRSRSFHVLCDMDAAGGGWTILQQRQDGSVNFNRTWAEYKSGFGELRSGEFWLGNNLIHWLTRDRDMVLRVELEDFEGVKGHAEYQQFSVASERMRFRLTVGDYSGTAGDALRSTDRYNHNNQAFTTPDRDYDRYLSGNCGAYYSSGWWFNACMAANLNGRYYVGKYKGVRDGIFWGTWHSILNEFYPTNDRQSFKRVRMMTRPKDFAM